MSNDNASADKPTMNQQTGILYVVATPIGNLRDMSERAIDTLQQVDDIFAEDTRQSAKLLRHYDISTPVHSLHQHNEQQRIPQLVNQLQDGRNLALISDAGTPLISDPGYRLITTLRQQGITIVPIPGACALISALSCCGLSTERFYFHGFLPNKTQKRLQTLKQLTCHRDTLIFYESCHRIIESLKDMRDIFTEQCRVVVARELTKKFESFYSGTLTEVIDEITSDTNNQKGEFVILIENVSDESNDWAQAMTLVTKLQSHMPVKVASQIAADTFDVSKNKLYQFVVKENK